MRIRLGVRKSMGWGLVLMLPLHSKPPAFTWTMCELLGALGVIMLLLVAESLRALSSPDLLAS